jgi:uncharacterized membrane protein YvbJ
MKCASCGTEFSGDVNYCPNCGTKLGRRTKGVTRPKKSQEKQQKGDELLGRVSFSTIGGAVKGLIAGVGVILVIVGIVITIDAHLSMSEYQTTGGQLLRAISEQQQREYQELSQRRSMGIIISVIGGLLFLVIFE